MTNPYLDIKTAAGRRQLVVREHEPLTIGRHADNKLVLDDAKASRFHCVIQRARGGQYVLRDLGASNGTYVNGRQVRAVALSPGDVVQIGQTKLVLVIPERPDGRPAAGSGAAAAPGGPYQGLLAEGQRAAEYPGGGDLDPAPLDGLLPPGASADDDDQPILLTDEEEVEELTDADLVDDGGPATLDGAMALAAHGARHGTTGPVVQGDLEDFETKLWSMAEMVAAKPFGETDIALLDARGRVVYPSGKPLPPGPRQPPDVLRLLLLVCFRGRATDVHLEPREDSAHARLRIDGVMVDAADFPPAVGQRLVGVVKVLGEIDMAQRGVIQEGNFSARVPAGPAGATRRVDYRVSFAPSVNGQKLVVRVLDPDTAPAKLADLKLPESVREQLGEAIGQESGMVLVSGPTGSGKTSTLYALIRSIDTRERNVVTIEDPVEIRIEDATQIPVDDEKGNTFPALLRSVLRQDPDVILVGEIRDAETARVAMQASITGHLVFSTVHTKDTLGTVYRLLDLGVEPYLLAQGLQVVVAQRLVRQLCPYCRSPQPVTQPQLARMGKAGEGVTQVYAAAGCGRCMGTGFAGRVAFFELLKANDAFRSAMTRGNPTATDLETALEETGFTRLAEAGYRYVAEGRVAFDEVDKAVGR